VRTYHWRDPGRLGLSALACMLAAAGAALLPVLTANAGPPELIFMAIDGDLPQPTLTVRPVHADGEWLLEIAAENFTFSAICTTAGDGRPIGHAHVYKGDEKIATAYQPILSLGRLDAGRHVFRVILRSQDHRALVGFRSLLYQDVAILVPADDAR
jgi:hypothetical protein